MSFGGTTGVPERDAVQQALFANIGNEGTRARSIELAVRAEAEIFARNGERLDGEPMRVANTLATELKDPEKGFDLNRRLLQGELTPEKWVEKAMPKKRARLASSKKMDVEVEPPPAVPAVAPAAAAAASEGGSGSEGGKKSDSSYYYFKSTADPTKYAPKKLVSPDAATKMPEVKQAVEKGHSSWNASGTWEDKDCSKWAHQHLKDVLGGLAALPPLDDGKCSVSTAWTVTGDASIILVRGRKKHGFELTARTTFSGEHKGAKVKGGIAIKGWDETEDPDDAEVEFTVKEGSGEAAQVVRRAAQKARPGIRALLAKFVEDFKAM